MHLAILGNHLAVVQILISNFAIDFSIRNDEGHTPLDLAVLHRRKPINKLLLKSCKPEISSIVLAVESDQEELVSLFCKTTKFNEKHPELKIDVERYSVLAKELASTKASSDQQRRKDCKAMLEVFKRNITDRLRKKYFTVSDSNVANIISDDHAGQEGVGTNEELEAFKAVISEFECPVCFHTMRLPRRIYSCSNDHYICSLCLTDTKMSACPQCREDFNVVKPHVRHTSEQILARLIRK